MRWTIMVALGGLAACGGGSDRLGSYAVLGSGSNDVTDQMRVYGDAQFGLRAPRALAFNPEVNGELWVINHDDNSVVIFDDAGTPEQTSEKVVDPYAIHFLANGSAIAFGAPGTFATCQDSRNTYGDQAPPNDFMGPTLWSSDRQVFGTSNPEAVDYLTDLFGSFTDLGSHLDMLHESPACVGIEWSHDNVYWAFDGHNGNIVRYDFAEDHGVGYDDHCDGDIQRWNNAVSRVPGVVSHLALDRDTGLLYIADTGNQRIAVLDTNTGERGPDLPSVEDGACDFHYGIPGPEHYRWRGGVMTDLVTGLSAPSGIALIDGVLFVADHGTGYIHAFDLEGNELDWADTGKGAGHLQGLYATSTRELWVVDSADQELIRIAAPD